MKYIKKFEKYQHTKQDLIDDVNYINEFAKKFEDLFEFRLNLDTSENAKFRSYIGHGADKRYTGDIILNNPRIYSKKIKIEYYINIDTDINPNGITGHDDVARTYVIKFELKRSKSRIINNLPHFYSYSINMNDVLDKFDNYISNKLGIRELTEEEIKVCKIKKDANKYNL